MAVFRVEFESSPEAAVDGEAVFVLRMGHRRRRLFLRASSGRLSALADFTLPLVLPAAMRHGADIEIDRPVSPFMMSRLEEVMAYLVRRGRGLKIVRVSSAGAVPESGGDRGAASFFSGGVDSVYTALTHRAELGTLVFLHGFDIPLGKQRLREQAAAAARESAEALQIDLLELEANWRAILDEYVEWEPQGHRLFMAAAALALAPRFGRVYVPAGYVQEDLVPARTDPDFYPTWSRPDLGIIPDGTGVRRVDKVKLVASQDEALRRLRVCWENRGGAYNCGRCEKCLRTMATLRILGALDNCPAFPTGLDLHALSRVRVYDANVLAYLQENIELLRREGDDPDLARALHACLVPETAMQRRLHDALWKARRAFVDGDPRQAISLAVRKRTHLW
jgi:hypothetical protein